jgi:TRAP-type C4-dicarboxylate transport system substrate-binding protein
MKCLANFLRTMAGGALLVASFAGQATDLTFGSWTPPRDMVNANGLPKTFDQIEQETKGAIKWKLIAGGSLLDVRNSLAGVRDQLADGGIAIAPYFPNLLPMTNALYNTALWGNDVVAATGAAVETMLLECPTCMEEFRKQNTVPLGQYAVSAYKVMCRGEVSDIGQLKNKKVRASAGGVELMKRLGAIPVAMDPASGVSAMQRGAVDCLHGPPQWLEAFGYGDIVTSMLDEPMGISGPVIGLMINRKTWDALSLAEKKAHLRGSALLSALQAIEAYVIDNNRVVEHYSKKGMKVHPGGPEMKNVIEQYDAEQRKSAAELARKYGAKDPEAVIAAYIKNYTAWQALTPQIGNDPVKMRDLLMQRVFDKLDLAKF